MKCVTSFFTLIEMIIVLLIIAVIAGFVLVNVDGGLDDSHELDVQVTMKSIAEGFYAYEIAYGDFPACPDAKSLVSILKADDSYSGIGSDKKTNPKRRKFLEESAKATDFWGNTLSIIFDEDNSKLIMVSRGKDGVLQTEIKNAETTVRGGDDIMLIK